MGALRALTVIVAAVTAAAVSAASQAATPVPPRPVVDQYVELVPTAEGPSSPRAEEERQPLPMEVSRRVEEQAGPDADALTTIATSSRYGAPQEISPPDEARAPRPTAPEPEPAPGGEDDEERPQAEAVGSVDEVALSLDARLVALLLAMGLSLVAAAAYELVRRRRD